MIHDGQVVVCLADGRRDSLSASALEIAVLVGDAEMLSQCQTLHPVIALGQVFDGLPDFHRGILPCRAPPGIPTGLAELGGSLLVAVLEGACLDFPAIGLLAGEGWVLGLLAR